MLAPGFVKLESDFSFIILKLRVDYLKLLSTDNLIEQNQFSGS